jgi:hypothetical protein
MKITNYKIFFGNRIQIIPMREYVEKRGARYND